MKIKGVRWMVLGLTSMVAIINYLDRGTLNYMWVANEKRIFSPQDVVFSERDSIYRFSDNGNIIEAPARLVEKNEKGQYIYIKVGGMARDLKMINPDLPESEFKAESKKMLSRITIFFMIAYGASQLLSGKLYDKIGTRKGFVVSVLLWSLADAFTSTTKGFKSLITFRFLLGLGEAGPWPGTTKSNAEWFPAKERALAQGIFNAATSLGSILAPIIISFLYIALGWKTTFIVIGLLGMLWIIPWLIINKKNPQEHPWVTENERSYIEAGQQEMKNTTSKGKSWGQLLRNRKNYSLLLGRFFLDPVWWILVTFLPLYLIEVFNLDIKQVAFSAWVPYVGAAIGAFTGGWFSGFLIKRGKSLSYARKSSMILGAVIAIPGIIGASMASTSLLAVLMMALILFGYQFAGTNIVILAADLTSGKTVGSLAGLGGAAAVLGTICSMFVVPLITKAGWVPFFIFAGLLFPLSLISVFIFARKIEQAE